MSERIDNAEKYLMWIWLCWDIVTILLIAGVITYKLLHQKTQKWIWMQIVMLLLCYLVFLVRNAELIKLDPDQR